MKHITLFFLSIMIMGMLQSPSLVFAGGHIVSEHGIPGVGSGKVVRVQGGGFRGTVTETDGKKHRSRNYGSEEDAQKWVNKKGEQLEARK